MRDHLADLDRRWLAAIEAIIADGEQTGAFTVRAPAASAERIMALLDGYGVQLAGRGRPAPASGSWPPDAPRWGRSWASRSAPADRHSAGGWAVLAVPAALAVARSSPRPPVERFVPVYRLTRRDTTVTR